MGGIGDEALTSPTRASVHESLRRFQEMEAQGRLQEAGPSSSEEEYTSQPLARASSDSDVIAGFWEVVHVVHNNMT